MVLLLLFNKSFSQKQNDFDSLRKYSYSILGYLVKNGHVFPEGGTCFFIRKHQRIFLITAKHVVSGCEGAFKDKYYPKVLTLYIEDSSGNPISFIPINISKIIDTTSCTDSLSAGIIVFEIKDTNTNKLFSVENFIYPPFRKTDDVEMFGFPGSGYIGANNYFIIGKASHIHIEGNNATFMQANYPNSKKEDLSVVMIVSKDLKSDSEYLKGYSGSPVFIKKYNSNKIRICGAFSEFGYGKINIDFKYIEVEKIEYAMRQIDALLLNDKK